MGIIPSVLQIKSSGEDEDGKAVAISGGVRQGDEPGELNGMSAKQAGTPVEVSLLATNQPVLC